MVAAAVNHYFRSSIGRKQLVAMTGLALCGFLVSHLLGNLLLLVGPEAFNLYSYKLISMGGLLYVVEAILALTFLVHMYLAVRLNVENLKARGGSKRYFKKTDTGRGTTFMSKTMPWTGLILLIFLILHLKNLKFGTDYGTIVDGQDMRDMYRTTVEYFQNIWNVVWYVFAMTCAALHTAHGFSSAFQSMGWNHSKYFKNVKRIGYLYAVVIAGGFAFLSVYCHMKGV